MYKSYVTNKSDVNVFVRLHRQQLSSLNENFHRELDQLLTERDNSRSGGRDSQTSSQTSSQTNSSVRSFLVRWGFCIIPLGAGGTIPFVVEDITDSTRMYASLYACGKLWAMDYEVHPSKYGCVHVNQHYQSDLKIAFFFSQLNPEPRWIKIEKGGFVSAGGKYISTGLGDTVYGRLSVGGVVAGKVTCYKKRDQRFFHSCEGVNGIHTEDGVELLVNTGHEFVRAKSGDCMPPHAVVVGVSDTDGPVYLGRVGGSTPCSVTTDEDKVKNFCYFSEEPKKVERGEIMVLTGQGLKQI